MHKLVELWEKPEAEEKYMIVGWRQWADAGSISSGLPQYLIDQTGAKKIGQINPLDFYLFQLPGMHHFLRPQITLEEGYSKSLTSRKNEVFYAGDNKKGLFIFLGDEPHLNAEEYGVAFFDMAQALRIKRIVAVGGVYGAMPYDKDRNVSCAYSLPKMKDELAKYAVRFSNYEGGATIGSYLLEKAEQRNLEFFVFYAFVPAYEFSEASTLMQGMRIDNDFKAWHDIMKRINHMFELSFDLTGLEQRSEELISSMEAKIDALEAKIPQIKIREYIEQLAQDFTERSFMPLDDVWERELGDLFNGIDN